MGELRHLRRQPAEGVVGRAREAENDFCFDSLPRIDEDNSIYKCVLDMLDGEVKGIIVAGENPAVGSSHSKLHRLAMAKLEWLVVRDLVEIETASFWLDGPEIETGELRTEEIPTEVFFLPAAAARREGRLVHEHAAPAPVALEGGRAEGRLPLRPLVLLPPRPA